MDWVDLTLSVAIIWIALDVAVLAMLISAASRRDHKASLEPVRPAGFRRLRVVSSRPGSARTRA